MASDLRIAVGDPALSCCAAPSPINLAVARLDAWLETLRGPAQPGQGYGGPVVHWWQQSLLYTGSGYDWRYEGILLGYLQLWRCTGEPRWLVRACRAGDDLLQVQLPNGHFPASAFELNPSSAGTPHEAAIDYALFELAKTLRVAGDACWVTYAVAARRNMQQFYLGKLWDANTNAFRDRPQVAGFVPNKAATACLALFAWSECSGEAEWAEHYALPNLERLLAYQVQGGKLHGAIAQNSIGGQTVAKYMPLYIARCIPALLKGYQWTHHERYLAAALAAMDFIFQHQMPDGGLPAAVYSNRQANRWPEWTAALGDVLLAGELLHSYGWSGDMSAWEARLLAGQDASGGFQVGRGFAAQTGGKLRGLPEVRDVLHVAGWNDKTLHYLAGKVSGARLPLTTSQTCEIPCSFAGEWLYLVENTERLEITQGGKTVYLWIKGEPWAREASPAFWLH